MSNYPDTLVAYVRHWGKVAEQVVDAKMTRIDTKVSSQHTSRAHNIVLKAIAGYDHHVHHSEVWE